MTVILAIWKGTRVTHAYISPVVPRVGDVLVVDRKENVRVTGVVWSFAQNDRPGDHDLGHVAVYVVPDPNPDFVPR